MDYTAAVDLEVLCESREGYRVVYEDLCPKSHWPDIFSLRPAVSAPQAEPSRLCRIEAADACAARWTASLAFPARLALRVCFGLH